MEYNIVKENFLTFVVDDKTYAFPVLNLQGVVGNPDIIPIINAPEFVVGNFNINDSCAPILDLRLILNKPNSIVPKKTCVIIARVSFKGNEKLVGFVVDSFFYIKHIQANSIEKLPINENEEFICGVVNKNNSIILLLNLEKIINTKKVIYFLNQFWNGNYQLSNTDNDRRNKYEF